MIPNRLVLAVIYVSALFLSGCTTPTPDNFDRKIGRNALNGERSCGIKMPMGQTVKEQHYYPNAGGDTVILNWVARQVVYDSASPRTINSHDTIVLLRANPSGYKFSRVGADLLICGSPYWQEILVVRHYCAGGDGENSWNNQIEEITFSAAGETWLADDLFDRLSDSEKFPTVERIKKKYSVKEKFSEAASKKWRVRPFRDVLPSDLFAGLSCNESLTEYSAKP